MSKSKQTKARSPLRRILKAVLRTACVLVFLLVFAAIAALLTVDRWVVPFAAWIADVEVVGEPGVIVFLANREVFLSGLKVKCPAGVIEARSCGFRLDGVNLDGWTVKEVQVSHVHAEGLRATLDFARYIDSQSGQADRSISGEKVRTFSHKVWNKASKPVVRVADLTLLNAEAGWRSGAVQSRITVSDLTALFDDGVLTRPQMVCGLKFRLNDPQRLLECGARIKVSSSRGGESIIVSATANEPLVIELPDSHLEFPASESTEMVMQYEPESDALRFGGEWTNSGLWSYKPWDLSMENTLLELFGTLALDGEKLRVRIGANALGSGIVCRGTEIPGDTVFEVKGDVVFDLATGGVMLDSVSGHLVDPDGGRLNLETSGVFEFVRHEDATYTLDPHAASLNLSTAKPVDLTPFDPVLPFNSVDKELDFKYSIELDPEKVCLLGNADALVRDRKTGKRVFDADAEFETDGVTRIGSFHVSHCGLAFYDGENEDRICSAQLAGKYNVRTLSLTGDLKYFPYRIIEAYGDQSLAELCSFLDDANLREARHDATAELDIDLVNMVAKLHKESHLSHLALNGTGGKTLELAAVGDADFRLAPDEQGWQLNCELDLEAGEDFHAVLNASGGSLTAISGNVAMDRLSDVLARQLERKFFPGRGDLPVLRFANASVSASFRCEPADSCISIARLSTEIDTGDGTLSVQCGSDFIWRDGTFSYLPMRFTMKTVGLPVSFWEPMLDGGDDFRFAGGTVTAEFDLSVGEDVVGGEGKLVGNDLTLLLNGQPLELARLGLNGNFQFDRDHALLILPELNVDIQDRQARQTLFASGSGTVDLANESRTRMKFPEVRFGPEVLYLIGYGVERSFYFEDLDTGGQVDFRADHDFAEMNWTGDLKINRLQLQSDEPEEYRFPELNGRLNGELLWTDGEMFGDVVIRLADTAGEEHISGRYLYRHGEDVMPKFISSSLDLPFAVSYFRYNHNTDPGVEKTAISLIDKTFVLDLHGIYARNHALIFSGAGLLELQDGDDPAILVPHAEFSGDVFGSASAEIHLKDGAWPFEVEADLNNIPFDKSFTAFLATDDSPEIPRRLRGFVKRLKASVRGEGFTTEALTKNLQADCKAELEGVSLRTSLRDRSLFLNILLLPLVSVPHLIDYVPSEMLRRALRLTTAGTIMDMISGDAPIKFTRGTMEMSVRHGAIELKSLELEGDQIENYSANGTIDLAGDGEAELETSARFALLYWPFYLKGSIFDPKVSYGRSISHFFSDNTKHLITLFPNLIINAFTDEEAEEIDRQESEKEKEKAAQAEQERKKE